MKKPSLQALKEEHELRIFPETVTKEGKKLGGIGKPKIGRIIRISQAVLIQREKKRKSNFLLVNTAIKQIILRHGVGSRMLNAGGASSLDIFKNSVNQTQELQKIQKWKVSNYSWLRQN